MNALTLVDGRDDTFQPLTIAPYRLIHSGDVKIYENLSAQARAFMVFDWRPVADLPEAIEAMRSPTFNPTMTAVVVSDGDVPLSPGDGSGTVEITQYTPEYNSLNVESVGAGLLVLTDAGYPGWQAMVDGQPVEVQSVNGLFRGVFLTSGEHEVQFTYRPRGFQI